MRARQRVGGKERRQLVADRVKLRSSCGQVGVRWAAESRGERRDGDSSALGRRVWSLMRSAVHFRLH
eukprot:6213238-Pleurochrysis_carterae.AAC.4